ncbi:MAG: hypothetical protein AB8B97_25710 [Granulosicoccus sp.]
MSSLSRLVTFLISVVMVSTSMAQSGVQIRSENGTLSVQASDVSASELAVELSNELGITVVVTGDAETRVNLDIVDEPLEKALGKLSPNNMLVRNNDASEIIEVVLMMGEGQQSSQSSGSEQFLPSGSPAEAVIDESGQIADDAVDPNMLRDPNRSEQARQAAGAASSDAAFPLEPARPRLADEAPGQPEIDPATGLPYE